MPAHGSCPKSHLYPCIHVHPITSTHHGRPSAVTVQFVASSLLSSPHSKEKASSRQFTTQTACISITQTPSYQLLQLATVDNYCWQYRRTYHSVSIPLLSICFSMRISRLCRQARRTQACQRQNIIASRLPSYPHDLPHNPRRFYCTSSPDSLRAPSKRSVYQQALVYPPLSRPPIASPIPRRHQCRIDRSTVSSRHSRS